MTVDNILQGGKNKLEDIRTDLSQVAGKAKTKAQEVISAAAEGPVTSRLTWSIKPRNGFGRRTQDERGYRRGRSPDDRARRVRSPRCFSGRGTWPDGDRRGRQPSGRRPVSGRARSPGDGAGCHYPDSTVSRAVRPGRLRAGLLAGHGVAKEVIHGGEHAGEE